MKTKLIKGLSQVQSKYDTFFIDLWGVIHNGVQLYPGAIDVLKNLSELNKKFGNLNLAKRLYKKSCDLNSGNGCSNLALLEKKGGNIKKYKKYLKKACSLYSGLGCYNLACLYSIENSKEMAFKYLEKAFLNGINSQKFIELMKSDHDLDNIKSSEEYKELIKKYF